MLGSFKLLFGQGIAFVLGILRVFGIGVVSSASTTEIAMLQIAAANAAAAEAAAAANLAMFSATSAGMAGSTTAAIAGMTAVQTAAAASATASAAVAIAAETAAVAWIPILIAAAIVALGVLVYIFWDQISAAFKAVWHWGEAAWKYISEVFGNISRYVAQAFMSFPQAVAAAMRAVIDIIARAISTIIDLLSYLNPFARHSPSLVDNVKAGVKVIANEYASLKNSMSFLNKAAQDLRNFADATAAAKTAARGADRAEQRKTIVAQSPNAGPAIDALYSDLDSLYGILDQVSIAIEEQEAVVAPLKAAYEEADWAVKNFEASMGPLRVSVEALEQAMDVARDKIDDFANTPIEGMKAMNDAIWENEHAQNKLKLEMLKLGEAGQSYDQIKDKLAALQGDLESTQATMTELRQEGAGSDVLQVYQEQLDALEAQKAGLEESGQQALDLQKQLEDLQRAGEILNLEEAVKFDPLIKQIEDLTDVTKEMSFDDIIAGITEQQAVLDDLTAAYTPQKAALDEQQKTLDQLILTRDQLKAAYDIEDTKLQQLNDTYSQVEDKIKKIEEALSDAATAADALTAAMSGGGGGGGVPFDALTGEDFEQTLEDAQKSIDEFIAEMMAKMEEFDIFSPFKDMWEKYEDWVMTWAPGVIEWLINAWFRVKGWVRDAVLWGVNLIMSIWNGITTTASIIYTFFVNLPGDIVNWVGAGLTLLGQWATDIITGIWGGLTDAATAVYDFFINLPGDIIEWVGDGLSLLAAWGGNLITGIWNGITAAVTAVYDFFINLPADIVEWVGDGLTHLLRWGGNLITGIWNGITAAVTAVYDFFINLPGDIVGWVGDGLTHLLRWGEDLITGIGDGIDNIIQDVIDFFTDLPGDIVGWLGDGIETLAGFGESLMSGMLNGIKAGWNAIADWWNRNLGGLGFEVGGIGISVPDLPKFHEGGVVGGNGEVTAILRSGEMVLTERQQAALFKMANNSTAALPATQRAGDKTIIFNGDLSFPNITSGDDAETFITNLEMLAGV
jgi:predicted nuclease with TOPRIM domain